MARDSAFRVKLRRRREGKTDYQARKAFILSGKPRLVPRSSRRNVFVQIVAAKPQGDEVLAAAHSKELRKYGWKASNGNVPAAYLTGLLCGFKAKAKGIAEAVLDIGLVTPTKGSKVFATLIGVVDAGLAVPYDEGKIVRDRLEGKHIADYGKNLSDNSEVYSAKFSNYVKQKLVPEELPEHFGKIKSEITGSFIKKGEKKA